jgi:hypothetical protein
MLLSDCIGAHNVRMIKTIFVTGWLEPLKLYVRNMHLSERAAISQFHALEKVGQTVKLSVRILHERFTLSTSETDAMRGRTCLVLKYKKVTLFSVRRNDVIFPLCPFRLRLRISAVKFVIIWRYQILPLLSFYPK